MTIRAIIFDLDGTLYVDDGLSREIYRSACRSLAKIKGGLTLERADRLLNETTERLSGIEGYRVSLTRSCSELGIDLRELHRHFSEDISPELFLRRDERVVALLQRLAGRYDLYLYTNNNRCLAVRIMQLIGIEALFRKVYSIEDSWQPKPDREVLAGMLQEIGCEPRQCLFVGDRYQIDLMLPEKMGAQVFLSKKIEELLTLDRFLADKEGPEGPS